MSTALSIDSQQSYLPASCPASVSAILGRDLRVRLILKHNFTSYGCNTIIASSLFCFIQTRIRISPSSISINFSYSIRLPPYPAVIVVWSNISIKHNCHIYVSENCLSSSPRKQQLILDLSSFLNLSCKFQLSMWKRWRLLKLLL